MMNPTLLRLVAVLEKVLATYVQALIGLVVASGALDISTGTALAVAALPAAFTALLAALPGLPDGLAFYTDLVLRAGRTWLAVFLGLLAANPTFDLSASTWTSAATAALPAALAVVKARLAARVGDPETAALLPAHLDTSSPLAVV